MGDHVRRMTLQLRIEIEKYEEIWEGVFRYGDALGSSSS